MSAPKRPRKTRSQLTTATARPERIVRLPAEFDPLETPAPLAPIGEDAEGKFKYDAFVNKRRYVRVNAQGAASRHFDPEQHEATEAYRTRLQDQPLDRYVDHDTLIDEERAAAALVKETPEAIAQFRADISNRAYVQAAASRRRVSNARASERMRRHHAIEHQREQFVRTTANRLTQAFTTSHQNASTLWDFESDSASVPNPDHLFGERAPNDSVEPDAPEVQEMDTADQVTADRALLHEIDVELDGLADIDDDEDLADVEVGRLRDTLIEERQQIVARINAHEDALNASDSDNPVADEPVVVNPPERLRSVPMINPREASDLLGVNALAMLDTSLRSQFMQLPEGALLWQLLQAQVLQHETHKKHMNLVEIVRSMALRGAKYGGLAHIATPERLGRLVDQEFYGSFINAATGELCGGHEHYIDRQTTRFVVLKFFCVRRNKANTKVVDGPQYATAGATTGDSADRNLMQLLERTDINDRMNEGLEHIHLNRAGLYDAHNNVEDIEDDGTDKYSSLHDIKYLDKEFMFCMRLVCVEAADELDEPLEPVYVSEDEMDEITLPPELVNRAMDTEERSHESIVGVNQTDYSQTLRIDDSMSSDQSAGAYLSELFTDSSRSMSSIQEPKHPAECHSDDDEEAEQHDFEQQQTRAATSDFMPSEQISISLDYAKHVVGRWHAPRFMQHVNGHQIKPLCIRSFLFYVNDSERRV